MKIFMFGFIAVAGFGLAGCSSSDSSSSSSLSETDLITAAKQVAPAFTMTSSNPVVLPGGVVIKPSLGTWGDTAYEIAVLFADDGDEFGVNNIYNNLTMAQQIYDSFSGMADLASYAFTNEITSPFFGTQKAYAYAANVTYPSDDETGSTSVAAKNEAGTAHILSASHFASDHLEASSIEGTYNETTGALTMDVVSYNDYEVEEYTGENQGKFIMRMQLSGSATDHSFDSLKVIKYNSESGYYYINIVGKGVSQGAGQYFLFRVSENNGTAGNRTDDYYCVAAASLNADTTFTAQTAEQITEESPCYAYKADVVAMTPFVVGTDLPSTDFTTDISGVSSKTFTVDDLD